MIHGAIVEKLGLITHLLDDVVRRVTFGARNSKIETVSAIMTEIVHRAVECGPMLFLIGRQVQFRLDPIDVRIAVGDDLFGGQLR